MTIERLPRLMSMLKACGETRASCRVLFAAGGRSILITLAPNSARVRPQVGPASTMQRSSTFLPASAASGDSGATGAAVARGLRLASTAARSASGADAGPDLAGAMVEVHLQAWLDHLAMDVIGDLGQHRRSLRLFGADPFLSASASDDLGLHLGAEILPLLRGLGQEEGLRLLGNVVAGELVGADRAHEVADILVAGVDIDVAAVLATLHAGDRAGAAERAAHGGAHVGAEPLAPSWIFCAR